MLDVEPDQFGPAQRAGKAEQEQRAIPDAREVGAAGCDQAFDLGVQVLHPIQQFGPNLRPIIGLAAAIVVFEGGTTLDIRELRAAGTGVFRLTTIALGVKLALGTIAAHAITDMSWGAAVLFGAITVVTGPTVVLRLLRQTRLQPRAASFLKWEAIVNDPVGAMLSAIVLEILLARVAVAHISAPALVACIVGGILSGVLLGAGCGLLVTEAMARDQLPEALKTPLCVFRGVARRSG